MSIRIDTLSPEISTILFPNLKRLFIHIIREDLLHPFISGNKFRKLKGFLRISQEQKIKKWVTFGGAWSNHLVATACAGAIHQIQTYAYVRGEPVKNPILFLCKQWGMELQFISRAEYRRLTQEIYTTHQIQENTLWIPEGGSDPLAFEGLVELMQQIPISADYLFTAVGTGTTLTGLSQVKHPAKIIGISVLKNPNSLSKFKNLPLKPILLHNYHLGGYAKTPPVYLQFLTQFSKLTGILLDPIYTGKMVYAVLDLIQKNFFQDNTNIYLLHTGGLTGILGKWQDYPS